MRIPSLLLITLTLLSGFISKSACQEKTGSEIQAVSRIDSLPGARVIYQPEDSEILKEIVAQFGEFQGATADLMLMVGGYFSNSPYREHSLEHEPESLVVNLREFDCTTFVESCLAISRCIRSGEPDFEQFISELRNIRYRKGFVDGYASRIHYFSDWIHLNDQKQSIRDISKEVGGTLGSKEIYFMSTHPESYRQLAKDSTLVKTLAVQEREISERDLYFVPKDRLAEVEGSLREGDIVGITTGIKGLDIIHAGILVMHSGRFHLLHASSRFKKVILSEETLEVYLANNQSATGIMVARPL